MFFQQLEIITYNGQPRGLQDIFPVKASQLSGEYELGNHEFL